LDTIVILAEIFVSFICLFVRFLWCGTTVKTRHKDKYAEVAKQLASLQKQMDERAVQMDEMREKVRKAKEQEANILGKFKAAREAHMLTMTNMGVPDKSAREVVSRKHLNEMVTATKKQGSTLHALCQAFDELNAITAKLKQLKHEKQIAFALLSSVKDQLQQAEQLEKVAADSE